MTKVKSTEIDGLSKGDSSRIALSTPENFAKVIWNSIEQYNCVAQLDHARVLHEKFLQSEPDSMLARNLALRIFQSYFELADQFALVCRMATENRPVFETYVGSENVHTRAFFNEASRGLDKKRVNEIFALSTTNLKVIKNPVDREKSRKILEQATDELQKTLLDVAKTYVSDTAGYSKALEGSFAVKHGFKMIFPDELAKTLWELADSSTAIMTGIHDLVVKSRRKTYRIIETGLINLKADDVPASLIKILKNMKALSDYVQLIAKIQLGKIDDPHFAVGFLAKAGIIKVGPNDLCPCGSGIKFKRCHRQ